MDHKEQTDHFDKELDRLVSRFISEYDLTVAIVIGVLESKKYRILRNAENDTE